MMDLERVGLVIFLTLLVVILFNIGLYLAFRGDRSSNSFVEMLQNASKRVRDPWKDETDSLAELSRRVKELNAKGEESKKEE